MRVLKLAFAVLLLAATAPIACGSKKAFEESDAGDGGEVFMDAVNPDTGLPACATGQYEATQAPAAMLVLLQRSGSMSQSNKWVFAAQAIVAALDQPVFDSMSVGLMAAPSAKVAGPACVLNLPVACGVPPFPQVDLKPAGKLKSSDSSGPRHDIKTWLTNNTPDQSTGDGNPLYSAVQAALGTLQAYNTPGKRLLFVVTDGGVSCTSLSNRMAYTDGNGCTDWENPNNIIELLKTANLDQGAPVETFIVGVPGSDSYDASGVNFPPYHMRAALSAFAKTGSPKYVPMGCNANIPFAQNDPDPVASCHFDMTQSYSSKAVSDAIGKVRGQVLGCVFDLPVPEAGMLDKTKVNVSYSLGANLMSLYRRKDPMNACSLDGCWDYTPQDKVELLGKACTDVMNATTARVNITVGCLTEVR